MDKTRHGVLIRSENGDDLIEVGAHVLNNLPEFSQAIGNIAAFWSQAEVNLNCLFSVLLNTTPEDAGKQLKKFRTAAKASEGAKEFASTVLSGAQLQSVIAVIDKFDAVRAKRNRIQHDVWAIKGSDLTKIYAVHANDYLKLFNQQIEIVQSKDSDADKADAAIEKANQFVASISNGYTLGELRSIVLDIAETSKELIKIMLGMLEGRVSEN